MQTSDTTQQYKKNTRAGTQPGRGFTLVELIAVLVLMGVLAGVAAPALSTTERTKHAAATRLIASDLRFARQHAVATGNRVWVSFEVSTDQWTIEREDIDAPGKVNAQVMTDPATERPMVQRLDQLFASEQLAAASFDGGSDVGFDWLGRPLGQSETPLVSSGSVTCDSGYSVTVTAKSGLVTFVIP